MKRVFLGRPIHWLLALILIGGGAALGEQRLHVIDFNLFLSLLLLAVIALIALVLKTSGGDAPITRDPITLETGEEEGGSDQPR